MATKQTKILHKRGKYTSMPTLDISELAYATDKENLYVGNGLSNIRLAKAEDLENAKTSINEAIHTFDESIQQIIDALKEKGMNISGSTVLDIINTINGFEKGKVSGDTLEIEDISYLAGQTYTTVSSKKFFSEKPFSMITAGDDYLLFQVNMNVHCYSSETNSLIWNKPVGIYSSGYSSTMDINEDGTILYLSNEVYVRSINVATGEVIQSLSASSIGYSNYIQAVYHDDISKNLCIRKSNHFVSITKEGTLLSDIVPTTSNLNDGYKLDFYNGVILFFSSDKTLRRIDAKTGKTINSVVFSISAGEGRQLENGNIIFAAENYTQILDKDTLEVISSTINYGYPRYCNRIKGTKLYYTFREYNEVAILSVDEDQANIIASYCIEKGNNTTAYTPVVSKSYIYHSEERSYNLVMGKYTLPSIQIK